MLETRFMGQGHTLGVIGGSGIYQIDGLDAVEEAWVPTPYGDPSGALMRGRLGDTALVFLARHGKGHATPPHRINYRANICALKQAGVTHLVSLSAVGSLKEEIPPGDAVVVDQFIDWTKGRVSTFFEEMAAHVSLADPVCSDLATALADSAERAGTQVHRGGTYLCMQGPQFSTRAESHLYRSWGASVIGMTGMPEAKLAREAEIPYAMLALATDYDCWHESEEDVSVDAVLQVLQSNAKRAKQTVVELASRLPDPADSIAKGVLQHAIITDRSVIDEDARHRLKWLLDV